MNSITKTFYLLGCSMMMSGEALSGSLEELSGDRFRANGFVRIKPDKPAEKAACKLRKSQTSGENKLEFSGRCATTSVRSQVRFKIEVLEPKKRYRLETRIFGDGKLGSEVYQGHAVSGSLVSFTANVKIDKVSYVSDIDIHFTRSRISKISHTVKPVQSGNPVVLFEVKTRAE